MSPVANQLVDAHSRPMGRLRVSVTSRCNFACVYCRPAGGESGVESGREQEGGGGVLSFEEIARVVGVGARLGLGRVRLTGGEPLVRKGLERLVGMIRALPGIHEITLTTNASLLDKQAATLKAAGLDRVNISLDSLDRETTRKIARADVLAAVLRGIDAAIAHGLTPLRLNAVVMPGVNDRELADLVAFAHGKGAIMRFIEYMPMGSARFANDGTVSVAEMRKRLAEAGYDLEHVPPKDPAEPARLWRCKKTGARVGFISSMTEHFCSTCDRMRLTADGKLRPCLHQEYEVDVRPHLGSDEGIESAYREAARGKWAGHRMNEFVPIYSRREMISIGG